MKILLFVHQREDYFKYRRVLKEFLEDNGHSVYVLMPSNDINIDFNNQEDSDPNHFQYNYRRSYWGVFDILRNCWDLQKLVKENKFDLIISFKFYPNFITGITKSKKSSLKTLSVVAGRGRFSNTKSKAEKIIFKIYSKILDRSNGVIVQNNEDYAFFKSILNHSKVFKINGSGAFLDSEIEKLNNLSPEELNKFKIDNKLPTNDKISFLFSSRIVEDKGILELIKAFNSVKVSKNAHLYIAGWFDTKGMQFQVTESIQNSSNITYIGNHQSVILPMAASDIVVLPTRYGEGVPRSLIEALAFQKPVITSNIAGCNEIVDEGVNGFFVDPIDVDDIVNVINKICLLNSSTRAQMSIESLRIFREKFDYHIVFNQIENVIKEISYN